MKVQEKDSDRRAEVHLHVQEQVNELAEYGQYVDPDDGALCSYVAVSDGDIIKITGRFHGTTLFFAHDLIVDGILRKACNKASKAVKQQKSEKLDIDTVLYKTQDGSGTQLLDTTMTIGPASSLIFTQDDHAAENFGTIELHLYVLRTFGTEHALNSDFCTYLDKVDSDDDEEDYTEEEEEDHELKESRDPKKRREEAAYRSIAPEFRVNFEKNCQEIDMKAANAYRKKLVAKRPCKEPWAIFRFHYRSFDAIDSQDPEMQLTHNPATKGKGEEAYVLELQPVPPLPVGAKPPAASTRDDASTREGSSTSIPGTPFAMSSPPSRGSSSSLKQKPTIIIGEGPSETTVHEAYEAGSELMESVESTLATKVPGTPILSAFKRPASVLPTPAPSPKRARPTTIAETYRQITAMKDRRQQLAKEHVEIDKELAPYGARIREKQEKLQKLLEEEIRAVQEEEQIVQEKAAMLAEFQRAIRDE